MLYPLGQGAMSAVAAHIIMYNIHAIPSPAKIRVSVYPVSCQESTVTRRGVLCENAKLHARYCASSDHLKHGTSHLQTTQPCQRAPPRKPCIRVRRCFEGTCAASTWWFDSPPASTLVFVRTRARQTRSSSACDFASRSKSAAWRHISISDSSYFVL